MEQGPPTPGGGLAAVLAQGATIGGGRAELLKKGLNEGLAFYKEYNESRLKLAFASFDEDMRKALYEIFFLLHVNDPSLENLSYTATRKDNSTGVPRYKEVQEYTNLYVENAPCGIKGIANLSSVFRKDMEDYLQSTFGKGLGRSGGGESSIVCLQSIGSIGTIGHKSGTSDLDLQVIHQLYSYPDDLISWSDEKFRGLLEQEHSMWIRMLGRKNKLGAADLKKPAIRQQLSNQATVSLTKSFPILYKSLIGGNGDYNADLKKEGGGALRTQLLQELMSLVKRGTRISEAENIQKREALFKTRLQLIQKYIEDKFPKAEIYMFGMSLDMYRAGKYTSSLEFKESSGSAYELILNYETLMPGIQFTPVIPAHFVFPTAVNNDPSLYQRLTDYIDFQAVDFYDTVAPMMIDMGHTPNLDTSYVAKHMTAAYWEAFKASSGNLPKATLNLLRFEMLIEKKFHQTIIQIIKDPKDLNTMVSPRPMKQADADLQMKSEIGGAPNWAVVAIEFDAPQLLQDPWWLRYKALKIGFGEDNGVAGLDSSQRNEISRIIDLAFALHVRISDVFTKPGDNRAFDTHREQVLLRMLETAFPPGTKKRTFIEHIFAGEVQAVTQFENELRANFRWCLERIQKKIGGMGVENQIRKNQEVQLWHQYYLEFFEPKSNVVQKTIMHGLKFPRGRLQIGYKKGDGWFFRSLQKQSGVGKRFDTFGILDHLPEEVTLIEGSGFLHGLSTCIVNGYYGILNRGSLKESRTALEFDAKHMDLGNDLDNAKAFISPDFIERMLERILEFFPYEYHHYLDYIRVDRKLDKVYLFLNLWHFGRLSILYRDNLNTWYCDEIDHPQLHKKGNELSRDAKKLFSSPELHESFDRFMVTQKLFVDEVDLKVWVNPNSVDSKHSPFQSEVKERELGEDFRNQILKTHPKLNRAG